MLNKRYNTLTLEALAAVLKERSERAAQPKTTVKGSKVAVLLGAGASVSGGVPLAGRIVQEIYAKFRDLVEGCPPSYAGLMSLLTSADRSNLLRNYINEASVNTAHLYLAQLVKKGYVDRILTTNFDSLAVQALVLVNERPFIYDLANLKVFKPGQISSPAVIHLHGQFGGFVNLHAEQEFRALGNLVRDVFLETLSQRALIVVGYGGLNDPVFEQLYRYGEEYGEFYNGLYWISHRDREPPDHVFTRLLQDKTKKAFYIRDYDADSFFMDLAIALGCGAPQIISQPFTFLNEMLEKIKSSAGKEDLIKGTRKLIRFAISCHEKGRKCARGRRQFQQATIEKEAQDIWQEGKVNEVEPLLKKAQLHKLPKAIDLAIRTLVDHAGRLFKEARQLPPVNRAPMVRQAIDLYRRALKIRPGNQKVHLSQADALAFLAQHEGLQDWEELFEQSFACYRQATEQGAIEYDFPYQGGVDEMDTPPTPGYVAEGYVKWGDALSAYAARIEGEQAITRLQEAIQQYHSAAIEKLNWPEAVEKWFDALLRKAQMEPYEQASRTLQEAAQVIGRMEPGLQEARRARLDTVSSELEARRAEAEAIRLG